MGSSDFNITGFSSSSRTDSNRCRQVHGKWEAMWNATKYKTIDVKDRLSPSLVACSHNKNNYDKWRQN